MIIASQAWVLVPDLFVNDTVPDFYDNVAPYLFYCDPLELPSRISVNPNTLTEQDNPTRNPLAWWLKCASFNVTGNYKLFVIPFSIGIMPLTYLLAVSMSKDHLVGLIALTALIFNPLYTDWVTNGTYDQVWAFFLILSVLALYKNAVSPLFYFISVLAKSLSVLYYPVWLYTAIKQKKKWTAISSLIIIGALVGILLGFDLIPSFTGTTLEFRPENWEKALFSNLSIFWQVLPALMLFAGLAVLFPTKRAPNFRVVVAWLLFTFLTTPIIHLFSGQATYSYRLVPFAVFMSIFVGMVILQVWNFIIEAQLKKALR